MDLDPAASEPREEVIQGMRLVAVSDELGFWRDVIMIMLVTDI